MIWFQKQWFNQWCYSSACWSSAAICLAISRAFETANYLILSKKNHEMLGVLGKSIYWFYVPIK